MNMKKHQLLVAILCLAFADVETSKSHSITDTPHQPRNTTYVERHESELDHDHIGNYSNPNNENSIKKLYHELFIRRGYDKAVRPVQNASDQVQIQLDFSYVQVLNLNEKDQILKSLLRTRIYWTDEFLMWTPSEYNGQTSLLVKSTDVWIPDVVMDEEVGIYDYSPRLPFLFVEHTGLVGLLQPSSFETSCRVNIAYFPFDVQECQFIFTTWTFPTSKADLIAKRAVEDMNKDVEEYFVATGEWLLEELRITKESISYADVVVSGATTSEASARSATLGPNELVKDVYPGRVLDSHWSELKFTLKFRRNSSLYMQSMLFPAILLTTVSLLGFYLPPDSGERIGLQITIMLTFMVFLLTVGDMFPASTGPYLGVYFVLCMALLGINIIMTVLVLHIHHMPCDAVMKEMKTKGVFTVNFKAVPAWIRVCLFLSGQYPRLKNFTVTEEKVEVVQKKETTGSIIKLLWQRCKTVVLKSIKRNVGVGGHVVGDQSCHTCNDPIEDCKHNSSCVKGHDDDKDEQSYEETDEGTTNVNADAQTDYVFINAFSDILSDLSKLSGYVTGLSKYMQYSNTDLKENRLSGAMEEQWKSVARSVDTVCLWVYIASLVVFHIGMFIAVVISAFSKEA